MFAGDNWALTCSQSIKSSVIDSTHTHTHRVNVQLELFHVRSLVDICLLQVSCWNLESSRCSLFLFAACVVWEQTVKSSVDFAWIHITCLAMGRAQSMYLYLREYLFKFITQPNTPLPYLWGVKCGVDNRYASNFKWMNWVTANYHDDYWTIFSAGEIPSMSNSFTVQLGNILL